MDPLERLVAALNEPHEEYRETLLEVAVGDAQLRSALTGEIAEWRADPLAHAELLSSEASGSDFWGRWVLRSRTRPPETRVLSGSLEEDGRIRALSTTTQADVVVEPEAPWHRLGRLASDNPIPLLGVLGSALYLALRLPLGIFYGSLGVTPEDVGFGPQVLIPQSLGLLAAFVVFMAIFFAAARLAVPMEHAYRVEERLTALGRRARARATGLRIRAITAPFSMLLLVVVVVTASEGPGESAMARTLAVLTSVFAFYAVSLIVIAVALAFWRRGDEGFDEQMSALEERRRRARRPGRDLRWLVRASAIYGGLLLVALPVWALGDTRDVRGGGVAGGFATPWRAEPVSLRWLKDKHVALTNDCKVLRLLGVGNNQLVLYDTKLDKLFRVPVPDASASVDRNCG